MMLNGNSTTLVLERELDKLEQKERPSFRFEGPQWAYWALLPQHASKFVDLIDVLKDLKRGKWDPVHFPLLADALAMGRANITPFALEWSFMYAPKAARARAFEIARANPTVHGLSLAVIGTHPFPPSTRYREMWVGFKGSVLKEKGAYEWV